MGIAEDLHTQLQRLVSEGRNPRTADIDLMSSFDIVSTMNAEDAGVAAAVGKTLPQIARNYPPPCQRGKCLNP